ncbi:MAG: NmrA family NAD(P)-binding protein, partial [Gemmatimonadota bacterium]|nr:NmrA family NAD(P)-binding protein [Gemmatimonadota bacterium]
MANRKTPRRTKKTDSRKSGIAKKVIAVVGATGAQGGGLIRAILNDKNGSFTARAITRNASSDKAKALADAGAEVVTADLD